MSGDIDTSKVTDRRAVRFASVVEPLADAERITAADRAGRLRRLGNWTPGQALGHVAAWIDYAFDGYPITAPPEAAARARSVKDKVLVSALNAGFRMPGVEGGTPGTEVLSADVGLARLNRAWSRLEKGVPTQAHPFFGPLTHAEFIALNLRHSELHQGFFIP